MSNFLNKIPVSPITSFGNPSVPNGSTIGTNFSILQTGGFMEVYTLSGLTYTIPPATTGIIEFSGNSIPIQLTKGSGSAFSPDVLILNSDNISSGRRKLGMLAYVYETNKIYQFRIDNYDTLWGNATGATGPGGPTVVISNFGTTVKNNSAAGIALINAWTASTISGIGGYDDTNASWRVLSTGGSGGGTSITGGTFNNNTDTLTLNNSTGGTITITGFTDVFVTGGTYSGGTIIFTNNSGGTFNVVGLFTGTTDVFVTGGTYSGSTIIFTNNTGGTFNVTGITSSGGGTFTGGTITGPTTFTNGLTANTISATTYQNLPPTPFLPLSGGTVTGATIFTAGLTGSSIVSLNSLSYCWTGPIVGSIFSYFNDTIYSNETGKTHYFGGGPGNVQNNLSVPNGNLQVGGNVLISGGLTANTISATTYNGYTPANDSNVVHILSAETITGVKTFSPNVTAASAIARGTHLTPTLVASANSDTLVGLDIAPTFTNGAFTGVSNVGLRVLGDIQPSVNNTYNLGSSNRKFGVVWTNLIASAAANLTITTSNNVAQFNGTTGNLTLQNGGTFTDAGYRLDVNGTFRQSGSTTATTSIARGSFIAPTLVASANSDTLVGLDIAPTFTGGAFTGVSKIGLRIGELGISDSSIKLGTTTGSGYGTISSTGVLQLQAQNTNVFYSSTVFTTINGRNSTSYLALALGLTTFGQFMPTTGNFILQNGGTFTDNGARLQVNGNTFISSGLTANTISATTYFNLPTDIRVTGGTYDTGSSSITFTNNTGGTFNVSGITSSGGGSFTGGTVSGATIFTGGLTANTISATTIIYNDLDYLLLSSFRSTYNY